MMRSVAERTLRQNDPQRNHIYIGLDFEDDDASIAQALEQNQYISYIRLRPTGRNANWNHLYRVIATRRNLVHFVLFDHPTRSLRAPVERIHPILQAIQQNASVRFVELVDNFLSSEDLCSFLDAAVHVTDLSLNGCVLTGGEQHGARDVAVALQRNTSIVSLELLCFDHFLDKVLEGLVSNTGVKKLVFRTGVPLQEPGSNAMKGVLESTRSIQRLELISTNFTDHSFRPFAQGLIDSSTVEDVRFHLCSFMGEEYSHHLNDVLLRKQNLRALAFTDCFRFPQFLPALFSALRRPGSPLRDFEWDSSEFIGQITDESVSVSISNQSFSNLCQAVAESKLESFSIRVDHNQNRIQSLADTIPSMKIRELVIQINHNGYQNRDRTMQTLHRAFKNNFTLQSVKYQYGDAIHFDASAEDPTLRVYLQRNIRLAKWVENPATVPKHLWKEATTLAAKAGAETLFRLLRKIGPEVLPVGSRKRKRSG